VTLPVVTFFTHIVIVLGQFRKVIIEKNVSSVIWKIGYYEAAERAACRKSPIDLLIVRCLLIVIALAQYLHDFIYEITP
jgi:hypothetical protein